VGFDEQLFCGREVMGIGAALFLIAAGAVLNYATDIYAYGVNFDVVGFILMLVGVLGLLVTLFLFGQRRSSRPDPYYPPDRPASPYYDRYPR
jgi:hypothetical protein